MNNDNKYRKIRKKLQFLSKNVRIRDGKKLKTIPLLLETMQYSLSNSRGGFVTPKKSQKLTKIFNKLEKNCKN